MKFGFIFLASHVLGSSSAHKRWIEWYEENMDTEERQEASNRILHFDSELRPVWLGSAPELEGDFVLAMAGGFPEWDPKNERIKAVCDKVNADPAWAQQRLRLALGYYQGFGGDFAPPTLDDAIMRSRFAMMMFVRVHLAARGREGANVILDRVLVPGYPFAMGRNLLGRSDFVRLKLGKRCSFKKLMAKGTPYSTLVEAVRWAIP